jgi:hypothetical protein
MEELIPVPLSLVRFLVGVCNELLMAWGHEIDKDGRVIYLDDENREEVDQIQAFRDKLCFATTIPKALTLMEIAPLGLSGVDGE